MSDYSLVDVLLDILGSHQMSLESRKGPAVACLAKLPVMNGHPQARRQLHLWLVLKRRHFTRLQGAQQRTAGLGRKHGRPTTVSKEK